MIQNLANVCVLCSQNCGIRLDVAENTIVAIRPDAHNPITRGYICNKAYSIQRYVAHAQRVRYPMRRRADGSFERISWDQAIAEIGERLRAILSLHPPRSFAFVGGGGQANHLDVPYALPFLAGIGSPMWFNALAQEKTQHALVERLMFRAPVNAALLPDVERSMYVLMLGTNPVVSNRGPRARDFLPAIRADARRTLVVVDPRRTETTRYADHHLAIRPGTDYRFLLALVAEIVQKQLYDRAFIAQHTAELDAVRRAFAAVDPASLARGCELEPDRVARIAREFAAAESACILSDLGIEQGPFSTLNSYLVRLLLALTGNLGNRGGNVFHGTFSPTMPAISSEKTRALVSGIEAIEMPFGMFSPNLLTEEILSDHPDRIRAVLVSGCNPMLQYADTTRYRQAFAALELLVVIEPAFTETAALAHYVLPAPVGYEKWEYSTFPKRYPEIDVQVRPPALRGPEEALPEAEIFHRIALAAGIVEPAPRAVSNLAARASTSVGAAAYLAATAALALLKGRGPRGAAARLLFWTYETMGRRLPAPSLSALWLLSQLVALTRGGDLRRTGRFVSRDPFAAGRALFAALLAHPEGLEVARLDASNNLIPHIGFRDRRIRLAPSPMLAEITRALRETDAVDPEFPLILNGGLRTHWTANTIHRDPAWRKGLGATCALHMHPDDAMRLGLVDQELVELATARGKVVLPLRLDDTARPGNVLVPNGFGGNYPESTRAGVCVNELTDALDRDPFTGCPNHKFIRCSVRSASAAVTPAPQPHDPAAVSDEPEILGGGGWSRASPR
jgi:anaerobic selenocysteine-containing dehydrogenase